MSRTHCARSFPTKLSISEPLDFFIVSFFFGVSVSRLLPLHSFFFLSIFEVLFFPDFFVDVFRTVFVVFEVPMNCAAT